MKCPRCHELLEYEKCDFVLRGSRPPDLPARYMPQTHYHCETCDAEFVRTGESPILRVLCSPACFPENVDTRKRGR